MEERSIGFFGIADIPRTQEVREGLSVDYRRNKASPRKEEEKKGWSMDCGNNSSQSHHREEAEVRSAPTR